MTGSLVANLVLPVHSQTWSTDCQAIIAVPVQGGEAERDLLLKLGCSASQNFRPSTFQPSALSF